MIKNPWEEMSIGSKRRASMPHEIFWIKEEIRGDYGLKISFKNYSEQAEVFEDIKFRNIEFFKAKSLGREVVWYLLLKEKEEWEIFYKLCTDILEQVDCIKKEETMLTVLVNRLKRWKKLLANKVASHLSMETQMGLFSELHALSNYITELATLKEAVLTWGGPELDIQDFNINDKAFEVKSHSAGRSESVTISSPYQMYTVKEKFYLIVYALSRTENGKSISDMEKTIKSKLLENNYINELDILDYKLNQYGYYELVHKEQLFKFNIDKISLYEIKEEFPKVDINNIPEGVNNLKYKIDLTKCKEFQVSMDSYFSKEVI